MNEQLRHNKILLHLKNTGQASIQDLVETFAISPATARRDINKLDKQGRLQKVRNGAIYNDLDATKTKNTTEEVCELQAGVGTINSLTVPLLHAPADAIHNAEEKERIAKVAAALCQNGDSIIINCGTTAFMMGAQLIGCDIQVITNYLPLANHLIVAKHERVVIMGGQYYAGSSSTMTPFEGDAQFYLANYMFTSGAGLTAQGLTKIDPVTIMTEQKMMKQASKLVALIDSSKLGIRSGFPFCPATNIDILITGQEADPDIVGALEQQGIEVLLV